MFRLLRERRTLIGIVALALLVAVTGWRRVQTGGPGDAANLPPGAPPDSDYALTGFKLTLLDRAGNLNVALTGSAMRHDPRRKRSEIDQPVARIERQPGVVWRARSESGWVTDDTETVRLIRNVRLEREAGSLPPLSLETTSLFLYPERELVQTDAEVLITQPHARLEGNGLHVNLAAGQYRINEQVKGRYEMPQPSNESS